MPSLTGLSIICSCLLLRRGPRHLRLPSRNVSGPPIPQPNIFPDCSRAQRERSGRFPARPSPPAAAEPYRVVLLTSLTSPEPGFMLVRGGGMGNRHEIRSASGRRRKANSYPSKYNGPPIRDLTQADLIRELQRMGISQSAAEQQIGSAIMMASILDRDQIKKIHFSDDPLTLDDLPLRWAAHCIYHGARPNVR